MVNDNKRFQGRCALVTGASAGIGKAYAEGLAARGANVVLVARRRDRLEELAQRLRAEFGIHAVAVAADLAHPDAATQVKAETDALGLEIDILVNNAGFGTYGPLHQVSPAANHAQVMVNVGALVAMTHQYLPGMIAADRGTVMNVSSIAALQPIPYMSVYGASKAFILSFTEALWLETRKSKVQVLGVCPGATDTEFFDVIGNGEETLFGGKVSPSRVVDESIAALDRRPPSVIIGRRNNLTALIPRFVTRAAAIKFSGAMTRPRTEHSVPAGGMANPPAGSPVGAPIPTLRSGR
ncbi:SDR family NAD(P)-dependent oxidoreductase [Nocardia sp. SYP-A9097]|uniref:SDR family NAD(P)-dependent oxidoreductase n=1 Tax=Nocardia sp. SYP-A9097 TaxID=2663237 RepID=UPI00129A4F2B|nr:SDR family oxidoreductase [Nocardia sp. SYP-A9097]MRH92358.1 SDR family NAD(P)-dependent oxidoreductase [Nocardia sp. SYP-A9097]